MTFHPDRPTGPDLYFPTTSWGRIRPGPAGEDDGARDALESLALRYWRPIHGWLRRALGRSEDEARDLAQDFFAWMIESGFVHKADPARGRFRAFLKSALRNYVRDADRHRRAEKRGGTRPMMPLDGDPESSWTPELSDPASRQPDEILDDAWRAELVTQALSRTEAEFATEDQAVVFAVFRDYFLDPEHGVDYARVAADHAITTVDVSNYLMRAKRRYQKHLRDLVADTVGGALDLEEELAWLLGGHP